MDRLVAIHIDNEYWVFARYCVDYIFVMPFGNDEALDWAQEVDSETLFNKKS